MLLRYPLVSMAKAKVSSRSLSTVVVTGATGDLGEVLLPHLARDERVERIIAVGLRPAHGPKVEFHRLDLIQPDAEETLGQLLRTTGATALYHLALRLSPVRDPAYAHELEGMGSIRVLAAVGAAQVPRLIVPSFTAVYGASPRHPALLRESAPLLGCPGSRFVQDKAELELQAQRFAERTPGTRVITLRLAAPAGPGMSNPMTRFLRSRMVPTLLGFDPRWQLLHAEDAGRALHLALHTVARGAFNIVGRGVMPLAQLIRAAGGRPVPVWEPLARRLLTALAGGSGFAVPLPLLDYLRYSCVADGSRAERELGFTPRHHVREAAASLGKRAHGATGSGE